MYRTADLLTPELLKRAPHLKDVQIMSAAHSLAAMGKMDANTFMSLRRELARRGQLLDRSNRENTRSVPSGFIHPFPLLHDSKDYMVISKPAGVVVSLDNDLEVDVTRRSSSPVTSSPELQSVISNSYSKYTPIASNPQFAHGILHRLDKQTTGTLLIAKTFSAFYDFRLQFAANIIKKEYICVVRGWPDNTDAWTSITSRIATSKAFIDGELRQRSKVVDSPLGNSARTDYRVLERLEHTLDSSRASLVSIQLHTGRSHQIRAHMASIGHPLIGDAMYGGGDGEIALHANRLTFREPGSDVETTVEASDTIREHVRGKYRIVDH
jgi:23S rRNA pseudouridine1911/1915/1917 synthase